VSGDDVGQAPASGCDCDCGQQRRGAAVVVVVVVQGKIGWDAAQAVAARLLQCPWDAFYTDRLKGRCMTE